MKIQIAGGGPSNPPSNSPSNPPARRPVEVLSVPRAAAGTSPPRCFSWLTAGLLLAAVGCGIDSTPVGKSTGGATAGADARKEIENQCDSILASVEDIFQLQRLGRTTAVNDGVSRLNDWRRSCAPPAAAAGAIPPDAAKLLSDVQSQALAENRFLLRDGEHMRNCMLERALSLYAPGAGQTEIEKVANVFGHVIRAVGLVPKSLHNLPLTPYETYLLGKGTVQDRAWIFVNILRQMKLDAVLLYPGPAVADAPPAESSPFLVGVLLDGKVYLFDVRLGVPVPAMPSAPGAPAENRVATLDEAVAEPQVLQQLDAADDRPYPIRAADLARPTAVIVGDSSLWSRRMEALQTQFVGARAMVISDPLSDGETDSLGVWTRVATAGGERWQTGDLRLWDHPESRLAAHLKMNKNQLEALEGLLKPFEAFMNVPKDPQTGRPFVDARTGQPVFTEKEAHEDPAAGQFDPNVRINIRLTVGEQLRARLTHLEGDYTQAVKSYTNVRGRSIEVLNFRPPPAIRSIHSRAIDDATFWTGLCQFEQGEFQAAADTLARFRKRPEPGNWMRESRYLLALSLAAAGDRAAAIQELESVEPDDPEYDGYRFLIRQWQNTSPKR